MAVFTFTLSLPTWEQLNRTVVNAFLLVFGEGRAAHFTLGRAEAQEFLNTTPKLVPRDM
jgi:hypothetical protein